MSGQSGAKRALQARMAGDKARSKATDAELNTRLNAIGALMKDCPDVNHRIALLAWGLAASMVATTEDERSAMMVGFSACVRRQLDAMDHMLGHVGAARLQ